MRTLTFTFILSLLGSFSLQAQKHQKFGFELIQYLDTLNGNPNVPLLVEGEENQIPEIVEQLNGKIRLQVGALFSLEIPAENVETFAKEKAVQLIEFSLASPQTLSDTMLINSRADLVQQCKRPCAKTTAEKE